MTGREAVLSLVNLRAAAHPPCDWQGCPVCAAREYLRTEWPDDYRAFHNGIAEMHRGE